jgi:hypothetical protein
MSKLRVVEHQKGGPKAGAWIDIHQYIDEWWECKLESGVGEWKDFGLDSLV